MSILLLQIDRKRERERSGRGFRGKKNQSHGMERHRANEMKIKIRRKTGEKTELNWNKNNTSHTQKKNNIK